MIVQGYRMASEKAVEIVNPSLRPSKESDRVLLEGLPETAMTGNSVSDKKLAKFALS